MSRAQPPRRFLSLWNGFFYWWALRPMPQLNTTLPLLHLSALPKHRAHDGDVWLDRAVHTKSQQFIVDNSHLSSNSPGTVLGNVMNSQYQSHRGKEKKATKLAIFWILRLRKAWVVEQQRASSAHQNLVFLDTTRKSWLEACDFY